MINIKNIEVILLFSNKEEIPSNFLENINFEIINPEKVESIVARVIIFLKKVILA